MRRFVVTLLVAAVAVLPAAAADAPPAAQAGAETPAATAPAAEAPSDTMADAPFATPEQRASYAIGISIGKRLVQQEIPFDRAAFDAGLSDALGGAAQRLSDEELTAAMQTMEKNLMERQEEKLRVAGEKNKTEGDAFLAKNREREGVTKLESGLQYEVVTMGDGPKPTASDRVRVHYRGTLLDGTEFDSSYERGQPAVFPVHAVIPGWTEALQLMPVGSKWKLWIPAELAYQDRGAGPQIGPNATLQFEVELLGIEQATAPNPHGGSPHGGAGEEGEDPAAVEPEPDASPGDDDATTPAEER